MLSSKVLLQNKELLATSFILIIFTKLKLKSIINIFINLQSKGAFKGPLKANFRLDNALKLLFSNFL
jgi:hypothetical protein